VRVLVVAGELGGDALLVGAEDVDREAVGAVEILRHPGAFADAEEHQRRVERERAEGVGGHAVHDVLALDGDDRHAGGEESERPAVCSWIDRAGTAHDAVAAPSSVPISARLSSIPCWMNSRTRSM